MSLTIKNNSMAKKVKSIVIDSKETLHAVMDKMIQTHKGTPYRIAMCQSYKQYDIDLYWRGEYKDCFVTYYPEWFAEGKIAIQ
jgi:hypothetical protein